MGLAFLGDIMLGRDVLPFIQNDGLKSLLNPIDNLIAQRHIIANLESPLSNCLFPVDKGGAPLLYAPVDIAVELRKAGISLVSLANNHMFDCGKEGVAETTQALDAQDIKHVGAGMNMQEATNPAIIHTDGHKVGIVSFSYSPPARENKPGVAYIYDDTVDNTISAIRKDVDFLIAMEHAGIELFQYPLPRDQKVCRKMIDLGVDLVIGSHPHCVQAMEVYKNKYIFYGMGDCIFDHHIEANAKDFWKDSGHVHKFSIPATPSLLRRSLIVIVDFHDGQMEISYEPLVMRDHPGPYPMVGDEKKQWLAQFNDICSRLFSDHAVQEKRTEIQGCLLESLRERGLL